MLEIPFRSARQLAADIKKRKLGCLELLDLYLARVEKYPCGGSGAGPPPDMGASARGAHDDQGVL